MSLCRRAAQNVAELAMAEPDAAEVCARAMARFVLAGDRIEQHIERTKAEGVEAGEADQRFDGALKAATQSYSNIFKGLMAAFLVREASGTASSDSHVKSLKIYLEGRTASSFAHAAEDDKVSLMSAAVSLADRFTDGLLDSAILDRARKDAVELEAAWENLLGEQAEGSAADRDLRKASEQSTRDYRVARHWITGCLTDSDQADRLAMIVPSLKEIYAPSNAATADEAAAGEKDEEPAPI
jgi:hypothetical protein